jgi:hypothetical protein
MKMYRVASVLFDLQEGPIMTEYRYNGRIMEPRTIVAVGVHPIAKSGVVSETACFALKN